MFLKNNNTKIFLIIIGVILILIQIINYCGVSRMHTGLYPDNNDLLYPNYFIEKSGLNVKKVLFAFQAGFDRFATGFEDLTFPEDEYRIINSTQYTSAFIRESLGCSSGGSIGLNVYDLFLLLSYCSFGIIGFVLLILAYIIGLSTKAKNAKFSIAKESQSISFPNSENEIVLENDDSNNVTNIKDNVFNGKIKACKYCGKKVSASTERCECGCIAFENIVL